MEGEKSKKKLVEVSPELEVVIDFVLAQKCRANVRLRSICSTSAVAFKVQTSSPDRFLVNPPSGVIPPLSSVTFQIILKPQPQLPPTYPRSPSDRFLIRVAVFGQADSIMAESINSWLSSQPPGTTQDIKLKVAFAGPLLLRHAVSCGDTNVVRKLIKRRKAILAELSPEKAESLLQAAADSDNSINMIKLLVELGLGFRHMGADVGRNDDDPDHSAVDVATSNKLHTIQADKSERGEAVLMAARHGDLKQLESLLSRGMITTFSDQYGLTAIHIAAIKGQREVVELLISHGLDLECRDNEGHTPLHLAVESGSMSTVEALIDRGADCNAATANGVTPLYVAKAMGYEDIAGRLEESGAIHSFLAVPSENPRSS
ncbi:uncharacterized protein LOC116188358 [Punica granatum]|uniref:Uncharacterized protein n=2 Tax=Punica granatum TaxID=22663 RepID=A0A2I0IRS6_PUNGR|nr:uncharacterized protein LOC116188358 [Punica granatum]PKI46698.1 hypothetical protein CRG98_033040 [Punica granatum]